MLYYKNANGQVFAYDSIEHRQKFGTPDLVEMTAQEVAELTTPPADPSPAEQIDALERQYMLPRPVRDVLLPLMEMQAASQGITPAQLRERNTGYRKVKELDEQISALRALI